MKQVNDLYKLLTKFLNRSESIAERKQLLRWFDEQTANEISADHFLEIQQKTKVRLLTEIGSTSRRSSTIKYLRYLSAAAVLLVFGLFMYNYWSVDEQLASDGLLASIPAGMEKATITLTDGKQVNLDELPLNQPVQIGETILTKDSEGKVRYQHAETGEPAIQQNSLQTPKGGTYDIVLTDGTLVSLNADSKLTYPTAFKTADRIVELEGEAYFHVKKTKDHKGFIVKTGNEQIRVLGTKFNINAYSGNTTIRTTLQEGSVIVSKADSKVKLKPNEQAFSKNGELHKKAVDLDQVLSWKSGQFYFDGTNTAEVLEDIARWYDIDVTYNNGGNAADYSGKIPRNLSLDKLIALLNYADMKTKAVVGKNNRINLTIT